jgi:hypothetical protein
MHCPAFETMLVVPPVHVLKACLCAAFAGTSHDNPSNTAETVKAYAHGQHEKMRAQLLEALCETLTWYGFVRGRVVAGFDVREDEQSLTVYTACSGYTSPMILGLLQAIAASVQCVVLVFPLPATACGLNGVPLLFGPVVEVLVVTLKSIVNLQVRQETTRY